MKMDVNNDNFEEKVIKKSRKIPVVVDFYANWCGSCLIVGPILENLEKQYKGKFILAKVNVDENRELAEKYKIMGIPAVKMFKNGKIVDEFTGALPEQAIKDWLDKNLR